MAVLERVGEEADRAAEILRRVRDFVQKTGPHVSEISLNDLIQEAVTIVSLELKRTRARIVCELAPDMAPVMADPIQIEQVVVNLARNGLESMDEVPEEQRVLLTSAPGAATSRFRAGFRARLRQGRQRGGIEANL